MHLPEEQERLEKLKKIRELGIDPYPPRFEGKTLITEALEEAVKIKLRESEEVMEKASAKVVLAGRLMTFREHGRLSFGQLQDESGRIQLAFVRDKFEVAGLRSGAKISSDEFARKLIDCGDFIGARGELFQTKHGEITLFVTEVTLLAKTLLPLPEKWHGLQDEDLRYRQRYLDFVMHPELKAMFVRKNLFWQSFREFLTEKGFLEVETPVLEVTAGGADADPFVTHHKALDLDLYLRISMGELWQKRLMVAGFEKTFEIGRQFRNEGMSREHLQDYTQMEYYWAYANFEDSMRLVEEMYKYVAKKTFGKTRFKIGEFEVEFNQTWPRIDYAETIQKELDFEIAGAKEGTGNNDRCSLQAKLKELKINFDPKLTKHRLIDLLWKQCRKKIAGPCFLVGHPVEVSPLAKRDPENPKTVQRFQVILAGSEMGNGYSELNDPLDQEERFKEQARLREKGDAEAQMHDRDFVEALKHGMPPTSGFGISERLFSFLEDKPVRECVMFPLVKPVD